MGYCPFVLQEGLLYCNRGSLATGGTILQYNLVGSRLYCNTNCIVARKGLRQGCIARQPRTRRWAGAGRAAGHAGRAWARRRACVGARTGATGSWACGRGAQRACGRAEQAAAVRTNGAGRSGRWSARGKQARQAGCSCIWHGFRPDFFFDSVFFLSH